MATDVILPALGMSQETGKIVQWLKREGEQVVKGEPLLEVETDKASVEIEAPADGVLARVSVAAGDDVPVGRVIARIETAEEGTPANPADGIREERPDDGTPASTADGTREGRHYISDPRQESRNVVAPLAGAITSPTPASPLASRIAAEHKLDLSQLQTPNRRIQKADVLAYLQGQERAGATNQAPTTRLTMASPKARRLATEQGKDLSAIRGSGPGGAVLAADVLAASDQAPRPPVFAEFDPAAEKAAAIDNGAGEPALSNIWRIMAERTAQSWTTVPHFYLVREVNASRLMAWREQLLKRSGDKVTYTDLLVKLVADALRRHPRLNASWDEGKLAMKQEIHVGLAVAVEEGLVVPVIHRANTLTLSEIARQRAELVSRAQAGKLRPDDIDGGTFTISNLGMYGVDAFNAIINRPQAAILAVGRIAERVVPINGQPAVQPMMVLTLSCDHRAVDGARGAQFLSTLTELVEEPLGLLE